MQQQPSVRVGSPGTRRAVAVACTALLAAAAATGAAGCKKKPAADDKSVPSKTTPNVLSGGGPLLKYVNQVGPDGKFIAPLKAPPVTRQVKAQPPLPDLPPMSKHHRVPPPPPLPGAHPCGSAVIGDKMVPLDCMDGDYHRIANAAAPLVSYALLHGAAVPLPTVVDHRADGTEGPVRDQGASPDCTAFSMAAAVDHSVDRWLGKPSFVSTMQLWGRYHEPSMLRADAANLEQPLAQDTEWPYSDATATSWLTQQQCAQWGEKIRCGQPVDAGRMKNLDGKGVALIADIQHLDQPADTAAMKIKLAAGQDVWIGMHVGPYLSCGKAHCNLAGRPGARYVQDFDATSGAGHALLIAGYATLPHSTYFLLHNSWGTSWGDSGYAWIHEDTLRRNIGDSYVIDAHPVEASATARAKRATGHTSCGPNLVPDSISAQCVPACPDGSPRHNAVCPTAGQCPAGYVNLTGACELAAPTRAGNDPKTSIKWTCGPGGCAYWVPKGVATCDLATCQVSCPSPDYRLGHGHHGLSCME